MEPARYFYLSAPEWVTLSITVLAILLGPVLAVLVTRYVDEQRSKKERQVNVLRSLIKTRKARLDSEHVAALNLIELEFHDDLPVMTKFAAYMESLSTKEPEEINEQERFFTKRGNIFAALVQSIGTKFGYKFDKMDLDQGGYYPLGWGNDADRQRKNAALITEVLEGKRPFPVMQYQYDHGKFPPKPE